MEDNFDIIIIKVKKQKFILVEEDYKIIPMCEEKLNEFLIELNKSIYKCINIRINLGIIMISISISITIFLILTKNKNYIWIPLFFIIVSLGLFSSMPINDGQKFKIDCIVKDFFKINNLGRFYEIKDITPWEIFDNKRFKNWYDSRFELIPNHLSIDEIKFSFNNFINQNNPGNQR